MESKFDIDAIYRVAKLYALGADRRDHELWKQILTEDCIIEGPGFRAEGIDANLANLNVLEQLFLSTRHRVDNQLMTVSGNRATGITYCTVDHKREVDGEVELLSWSIRYQDELIRGDSGWRFTRRQLVLDWEEIRRIGGSVPTIQRKQPFFDERVTVAQLVYNYALGIDTQNWTLFRSIFTDEIYMDFESWNGIKPYKIAVDDLVRNISVYFAGLDSTQHSLSNPQVQVTGNKARCVVYMQAEHFLCDEVPNRRFVIGGYYTDELVNTEMGWKIQSVKLTVLWERGDKTFMDNAPILGMTRLEGR